MTSWKGYGSNNSSYYLELTVTEKTGSASAANNTSVVEWKLDIVSTGASFSQYNLTYKVSINDVIKANKTVPFAVGANSRVNITSGTDTITHNADGTKTINVSASASVPTYTSAGAYVSYTPGKMEISTKQFTLGKIDRIGTVKKFNASRLDAVMNVEYDIHRTEWYHRLLVEYGSDFSFVIEDYVSGAAFSLAEIVNNSESALVTIKKLSVNSKQITLTASIQTYTSKGGTYVGATSASMVFNVGGVPTISDFTVTETRLPENITVKDMSHKAVSASLTATDYASIKSAKITAGTATAQLSSAGGNVWNGYITGMLSTGGTIDYTLTVEDSRGYVSSKKITQNYYEYSAPSIESVIAYRAANPNGSDPTTPNTEDALGVIEFKVRFTDILQNKVTAVATGDLGTEQITGGTGGLFNGTISIPNADYRSSFNIVVTFTDELGGRISTTPLNIPLAIPTLSVFDDEVDFNCEKGIWVNDLNATPIADLSNLMEYVFDVGHLQLSGHYTTGLLFGCTAANANTGAWMYLLNVSTTGSVTLEPIVKKNSITLTGSIVDGKLKISASSTVWGGIRIIWIN